ncbi:hypothetical protein QBC43DRAFT_337936 [Cladorrhinum sp. PSN259]|nr:hypothetical protein QBC43DRAFT_337936 [Cladorrhinum sp. PSN259]
MYEIGHPGDSVGGGPNDKQQCIVCKHSKDRHQFMINAGLSRPPVCDLCVSTADQQSLDDLYQFYPMIKYDEELVDEFVASEVATAGNASTSNIHSSVARAKRDRTAQNLQDHSAAPMPFISTFGPIPEEHNHRSQVLQNDEQLQRLLQPANGQQYIYFPHQLTHPLDVQTQESYLQNLLLASHNNQEPYLQGTTIQTQQLEQQQHTSEPYAFHQGANQDLFTQSVDMNGRPMQQVQSGTFEDANLEDNDLDQNRADDTQEAEERRCSTCRQMKTNIPAGKRQCLNCTAEQSARRQQRINERLCPRGGDKPGHRGGPNCPGCAADFARWRANKKQRLAEVSATKAGEARGTNAGGSGGNKKASDESVAFKKVAKGGATWKAATKTPTAKTTSKKTADTDADLNDDSEAVTGSVSHWEDN